MELSMEAKMDELIIAEAYFALLQASDLAWGEDEADQIEDVLYLLEDYLAGR